MARAAGRGKIRAAGAGDGRSWYVVVSGELMRAEDRADGGHRGGVPIGGGAVFQCRTLEWVVRNIPKCRLMRGLTHRFLNPLAIDI